MVVERHGEVVRDEVLGGTAEVHGVPVLELRPSRQEKTTRSGQRERQRERATRLLVCIGARKESGRSHNRKITTDKKHNRHTEGKTAT